MSLLGSAADMVHHPLFHDTMMNIVEVGLEACSCQVFSLQNQMIGC